MRCLVASCFGLALVVAACGCRSCHRVESELRARETDVRELREELDRCSIFNQALQHELRSLRGDLPPGSDGQPPAAYPVRSIVLGRQTGGRDSENCPGDSSLQVQLEPRDTEGHAIKAPGSLFLQVQEITKEGVKRPLSSWEIPQDKLRKTWKPGLLTTGYVLNLPWKVWPSTDKLRVTAQFQLADGRVFEADKDITVRVTPADRRPVVAPEAKPPDAESGPVLPAPRTFDPAKLGQTNSQPESNGPSLLWKSVEPQTSSVADILSPVPLPPKANP